MKTTIKETVFNAIADYLVARKAYTDAQECILDCYLDEEMIINTIVYLGLQGEPNAQSMYESFLSVLED